MDKKDKLITELQQKINIFEAHVEYLYSLLDNAKIPHNIIDIEGEKVNIDNQKSENQGECIIPEHITPDHAKYFYSIFKGRMDVYSKRAGKGKYDFIVNTLRKALVKSYLGKTVDIIIDRPIGSVHPRHRDIIYPINYGYIPNIFSGDGEELDVYLLGVDVPVEEYTARIIGIIHRKNDVEDKLVAASEGVDFTEEEISKAIYFQEQYFDTVIEMKD